MLKKELIIGLAGFAVVCIFLLYMFLGGTEEGADDEETILNRMVTTRYSLSQMREFAFKNAMVNEHKHPMAHNQQRIVTFSQMMEYPDKNRFRLEDNDVIVFLHIQKTAGTSFERFLVRRLNTTHPCQCDPEKKKKKCQCRQPNGRIWLFSRYSTGWACGLHADYTELITSGCVSNKLDMKEGKRNKRRLYLTTFLRDPVERLISEYSHVQRGATWARSRHLCGGRQPTPEELPMCFDPDVGWEGVELDEFLSCPYNLAFNRQTRMLADLTRVHCYNSSAMNATVRDQIMLESAKHNLRQFAFFGLKERVPESQFLFEQTFGLNFDGDLSKWNRSKSAHIIANESQLKLIRQRNALDLALYEFARRIFERRLAQMGWKRNNTSLLR